MCSCSKCARSGVTIIPSSRSALNAPHGRKTRSTQGDACDGGIASSTASGRKNTMLDNAGDMLVLNAYQGSVSMPKAVRKAA